MEPKKYWWLLIQYVAKNTGAIVGYKEIVMEDHPFHYISGGKIIGSCINDTGIEDTLCMYRVDWKIISVEEYNLFNELNNK